MSTQFPQMPGNGAASASAGGGRPILSPDYLLAHRVGVPGQKDVIWAPLYDFIAYPSAGFPGNQATFFSNQQGQGISSAPGVGTNVPKSQWDTNLQAPNQLTLGNEFYMIGTETLFYPGVSNVTNSAFALLPGRSITAPTSIGLFVDDVWEVGNQGFKAIKIGTDRYYVQDGPLMLFPPCTRLAMNTSLTGISATNVGGLIEYAAWSGEGYSIVPIYIQTNQLFTVTYSFATQIALPSGAIGRIGERMRGYLIRQAT